MRRIVSIFVLCGAVIAGTALTLAYAGNGNAFPSHSLGKTHGLDYRSVSTPFTGEDIDLFAQCTETAAVVGGGIHVTGPAAGSQLAYGRPRDDEVADADQKPDDQWAGGAMNLPASPRAITTYAICRQSGPTTVRYPVHVVHDVAPGSTFSAKATCPAGSHVVSGGSDVYRGRVPVSVPFDSGDGDRLPDDGWRIRARNDEGSAFDLTVHAVCLLGPVSDLRYRVARGKAKAGKARTLVASCRDDAVVGGGVAISGSTAKHFIHSNRPRDAASDANSTPDDLWQATAVNDSTRQSKVAVYAICLS